MTLRPIAICLVVASTLSSGGALAEDAAQGVTKITANYGVYWAGLQFGDVRLDHSTWRSLQNEGQRSILNHAGPHL